MFDTKLVCFESTYGTLLCECLLNGLAATQPPHFLLHCNELEIRSTKRFFFFQLNVLIWEEKDFSLLFNDAVLHVHTTRRHRSSTPRSCSRLSTLVSEQH